MELFYRKFGSGPPLIILHGLYGASDNWHTIGKALSEYFEVFIIDQRNHGRSPHSDMHNYELMKNDLLVFMDSQNIDRATLLGHSMGGKTAMFFAAEFSERIDNLIIVDIAPKSYIKDNDSAFQVEEHLTIMDSMLNTDLSLVKSRSDVDNQLAKSIKSFKIRQFLLKNLKRDKNKTFYWKLNITVLRKELSNIMEGLNPSGFEKGNVITGFPVLFVKGEKSNYISKTDITGIKNIFSFAEIVTITDAGHWLHAEQPELFIKTVLAFILE